jgi:hypothetical protein
LQRSLRKAGKYGADLDSDTPRTTREILPVLMQLIMSLLGSPEPEQQEVRRWPTGCVVCSKLTRPAQTASRTLGELCRKNGERIFGEIIPILQKAITSQDPRAKEGACLAFADVMCVYMTIKFPVQLNTNASH